MTQTTKNSLTPPLPSQNFGPRTYTQGQLVVKENEISNSMFYVKSGQFRVFKMRNGRKIVLEHLGPGNLFGELSFFDNKPRSASVETMTEGIVVEIPANQSITSLPEWFRPVLTSLLGRVRSMSEKIAATEAMFEYQRLAQRERSVEQILFSDLLRIVGSVDLILLGPALSYYDIIERLRYLVGSSFLITIDILALLHEHKFIEIDQTPGSEKPVICADPQRLRSFVLHLHSEIETGRLLILEHSGFLCLQCLVENWVALDFPTQEMTEVESTDFFKRAKFPRSEEIQLAGIRELAKSGVIQAQKDGSVFRAELKTLQDYACWQTILKHLTPAGPTQ